MPQAKTATPNPDGLIQDLERLRRLLESDEREALPVKARVARLSDMLKS